MSKTTDKLAYKVYIEFFNYWNEVTSKDLVAAFRSENWARHFIDTNETDNCSRFIIEKEN